MSLCFIYIVAKRTSLPLGGIEGGLLFILHIHRFAFQHIGKLVRSDRYGTLHEFRDVITTHELPMIVRVGSRQLERLGAFSLLVNMSDKRTGIVAIDPATAEDDPTTIG